MWYCLVEGECLFDFLGKWPRGGQQQRHEGHGQCKKRPHVLSFVCVDVCVFPLALYCHPAGHVHRRTRIARNHPDRSFSHTHTTTRTQSLPASSFAGGGFGGARHPHPHTAIRSRRQQPPLRRVPPHTRHFARTTTIVASVHSQFGGAAIARTHNAHLSVIAAGAQPLAVRGKIKTRTLVGVWAGGDQTPPLPDVMQPHTARLCIPNTHTHNAHTGTKQSQIFCNHLLSRKSNRDTETTNVCASWQAVSECVCVIQMHGE